MTENEVQVLVTCPTCI